MTAKEKNHEHDLICHIYEGKYIKTYIGKINENPGIIVSSKDKEGVKEKLKEAISAYFDAFPEQHDIVFKEQEKILITI